MLLCRRADNKRKDYGVFADFCLRMVKHVNPPAVCRFLTIVKNRERIRAEGQLVLHVYIILVKVSHFSFVE